MRFLFGERGVLAALQDAFHGKGAGEDFSVTIPAEQAYGRRYPRPNPPRHAQAARHQGEGGAGRPAGAAAGRARCRPAGDRDQGGEVQPRRRHQPPARRSRPDLRRAGDRGAGGRARASRRTATRTGRAATSMIERPGRSAAAGRAIARLRPAGATGIAIAAARRRAGKTAALVGGFVLALTLAACAQNPVTGDQDFLLVSEDWELAVGRQQYAPLRQAQGGDYVGRPGRRGLRPEGRTAARGEERPEAPVRVQRHQRLDPERLGAAGGEDQHQPRASRRARGRVPARRGARARDRARGGETRRARPDPRHRAATRRADRDDRGRRSRLRGDRPARLDHRGADRQQHLRAGRRVRVGPLRHGVHVSRGLRPARRGRAAEDVPQALRRTEPGLAERTVREPSALPRPRREERRDRRAAARGRRGRARSLPPRDGPADRQEGGLRAVRPGAGARARRQDGRGPRPRRGGGANRAEGGPLPVLPRGSRAARRGLRVGRALLRPGDLAERRLLLLLPPARQGERGDART